MLLKGYVHSNTIFSDRFKNKTLLCKCYLHLYFNTYCYIVLICSHYACMLKVEYVYMYIYIYIYNKCLMWAANFMLLYKVSM